MLSLNKQHKDLIKKLFTVCSLKGGGAFFSFILSVVIGRFLGVSDAGIFFLGITMLTVLGGVARVGLDNFLIRSLSVAYSSGNDKKVKGDYQLALVFTLGTSFCLCIVGFFSLDLIIEHFFSNSVTSDTLGKIFIALPAFSLIGLHAFAFQGLHRVRTAGLFGSFLFPCLLALFSSMGVLLTHEVYGAFWGVLFAAWCGAIIAIWGWRKEYKQFKGSPIYEIIPLITSCSPLLIVLLCQYVINWSGNFFLAFYSTTADVGAFSAATRVATILGLVLAASNTVMAPRFASMYSKKSKQLPELARKTTLYLIAIVTPLLFLMGMMASNILSLFGSGFVIADSALKILLIGQGVNVMTGAVGLLLMMTGNEISWRNCLILAAGLHVFLCIVLIPMYGLTGAAVASSLSLSTQMILASYLVYKKLNIAVFPFISQPYYSVMTGEK